MQIEHYIRNWDQEGGQLPDFTYQRIPQGYIIICTVGQDAGLNIPIRGGGVPISADANVFGGDGDHKVGEGGIWSSRWVVRIM